MGPRCFWFLYQTVNSGSRKSAFLNRVTLEFRTVACYYMILCYGMILMELVQLIHLFVNAVMKENLQNIFCCVQGRSDGGYIGIYTPQNQSTQDNLCGCSPVIQDRFNIVPRTVRLSC